MKCITQARKKLSPGGHARAQLPTDHDPIATRWSVEIHQLAPAAGVALIKIKLAGASLDHLVGEQLDRVGDLNAERPGGLQVDDKFKFGRL
jgi:hypothetical protein